MNPGRNEALANRPFIGPSGTLLHTLLRPLPPVPTYLTNAARCSTPGFDPTDAHYRACAPYLLQDLRTLTAHHGPLTILCLGTPATQQLHRLAHLKRPKVTAAFSHQGTTLTLSPDADPLPVVCFFAYHPAAILRDPTLSATTRDHFRLVHDHLLGLIATPSRPHLVPPAPPDHSP